MTEIGVSPILSQLAPKSREMLRAVVDLYRERGSVDLSLREVAAGIGTSHRMLRYHLGGPENLHGLAMLELSHQYLAHFDGQRPTDRVGVLKAAWGRFRDPGNRLQTQLLFRLSAAATSHPDVPQPALSYDLDQFAKALETFGLREGLDAGSARREARLIVAALLGLYLDFYVTGGSDVVDESFLALTTWVQASSRAAGLAPPATPDA